MKSTAKRAHRLLFELMCLALVICMAVGALPIWAAEEAATDASETEQAPATVKVLVAKKDIKQGTYITDEYVEVIDVPNYNLPPNTMNDIEKAMRKYATENIYEGEYLSPTQVSSKKVAKESSNVLVQDIVESTDAYVIVTDYIKANTGKDIASNLQELIDKNPKKTIYFPAGEYLIGSSIYTSAVPSKSVSLKLADGAVIKAHDKWTNEKGSHLISMGASQNENDIRSPGSYYSFIGGTLDGNGEANGLEIKHGRESLIREVCIRNVARKGVTVQEGSNSGSSDIDFEDITIIGSHVAGSIGLEVIGYDNTFTNFRIYDMDTGAHFQSGGNLVKNFSVYNTDVSKSSSPESTVGLSTSDWSSNWISGCTVENQATAYKLGSRTIFYDCTARWTTDACTKQTAINAHSPYLTISSLKAEFYGEAAKATFLELRNIPRVEIRDEDDKIIGYGRVIAKPIIEGCMFDTSLEDSSLYTEDSEFYSENTKFYERYLKFPVIPLNSQND